MKPLSTILLPLIATTTFALADIAGGEASIGFFSHTSSGSSTYEQAGIGTSADLEDTLGLDGSGDMVAKLYLEHPVPMIPNMKLGYTKLSQKGDATVNNFDWGSSFFNFSGAIDSSIGVTMTDATLYYELVDTIVDIDAGLTARYISGDTDITSVGQTESLTFSSWIPMLYGKGRVTMPLSGLALQVETNYIGYGNESFYDVEAAVRYTMTFGFAVEAGYKTVHIESNGLTDGFTTDMDISGVYASVVWDF